MSFDFLKYVGLDVENIDEKLIFNKSRYTAAPLKDEGEIYRTYKFLKVKDIDILISDCDRTATPTEKYEKAIPLDTYIREYREKFDEIVNNATMVDLVEIEKMQRKIRTKIPFFIKYENNYLWQIFYSMEDDRYFMIFPSKSGQSSILFYLIQQKLQDPDLKVFVPVCRYHQKEELLTIKEIDEIEKYLWSFTKHWPTTYQVFNEKDKEKYKNYIIGKTEIFDGFYTRYKIEINSREDGLEFYTVLKAMFILSTETNYQYKPKIAINRKGELVFLNKEKAITVNNLSKTINLLYKEKQSENQKNTEEIEEFKTNIKHLKEEIQKKSALYAMHEKQIVMFLECKQNFFKKLRYFFSNSSKKMSMKSVANIIKENEKYDFNTAKNKIDHNEKLEILDKFSFEREMGKKEEYTISDLVSIFNEAKEYRQVRANFEADYKVLLLKNENLDRKINNAKNYIDEIEKHKKSIFEFWKFTNKDKIEELQEGHNFTGESNIKENKITGVNFEEDIDELAKEADRMQRRKLSTVECDAIYASQFIIDSINAILEKDRKKASADAGKIKLSGRKSKIEKQIEKNLNDLKENYDRNLKIDIFGDLLEENKASKLIKNKEFREINKNVYSILKITDGITIEEFEDRVRTVISYIKEALERVTSIKDITIYYPYNDDYTIGSLNPREILRDKEVFKIYKTTTNYNMNILYFTNIMYFYNNNKTLPEGMDVSKKVLIKPIFFENEKITEFNLILENSDFDVEIREIQLIEDKNLA